MFFRKKAPKASAEPPVPDGPYIHIRVVSAVNVLERNGTQSVDSRIRLTLGDIQRTTSIKKNQSNPTWNEDFVMAVEDTEDVLHLQLCDASKLDGKGQGDDGITACNIRLNGLLKGLPQAFTLHLQALSPDCLTTVNVIIRTYGFGVDPLEQLSEMEEKLRDQLNVFEGDDRALLVTQDLRQQALWSMQQKLREEEERKEEEARLLREEEERRAAEEALKWDREPFDQEHARLRFEAYLKALDLQGHDKQFYSKLTRRMERLIKKHIAGRQRGDYYNTSQHLIELTEGRNTSEAKVRLWIETLLGQECVGTTHQWLRSGAVLCRLINAVNPGLIEPSTVSESAEPMRQRSNIKQFLDCCGEMGLHEGDRFLIDDLYSNRDMKQVYICVQSLSEAARYVRGFKGPFIDKPRTERKGTPERADRRTPERRKGSAASPRPGVSPRTRPGAPDVAHETD